MNLNKAKGRMFKFVTHTWHPIIGCLHYCSYCWARDLCENRLKKSTDKYRDGFYAPKLIDSELEGEFKVRNAVIGVSLTGDMWGWWVPRECIIKVLDKIKEADKSNRFLFQTKNPMRYHEFISEFPRNVILGTTIETNRSFPVSKAPPPYARFLAIKDLPFPKFLSIEPIMSFHLATLLGWIHLIKPVAIEIGADNYNHNLPEPTSHQVNELLNALRSAGYRVIEKEGLSRLKKKEDSECQK